MGCRCHDISRCSQDISTLQGTLHKMKNLQNSYSQLLDGYNKLVKMGVPAYELEGAGRNAISMKLRVAGANTENSLQSARSDIERKISQLNAELNGMRNEDHRHHTEEARRRSEVKK